MINSSNKRISKLKFHAIALLLVYVIAILLMACVPGKFMKEQQITISAYNHDLDNNDNFSPDDQWLVYDTRTEEGGIGANGKIEKVNVVTGEKIILYELEQIAAYGPGVGAVSYSHTENEVVFIHGLLNCSSDTPYEQWRRTGVIIRDNDLGNPIFIDARNTTAPFIKGALRGGTHRHEFSGDGQWIGFTYNDELMKNLVNSTGINFNLRTIGVSKKGQKVDLENNTETENVSGEWFSALVVKVVPKPAPGSDEISRATGDSWVGKFGYKKSNSTLQRARAFIGTVRNEKGYNVDEVFIVDIPDDISVSNKNAPLEGTETTMPLPPKDTYQRRLTYTANSNFPGCEGIVRSSYDGNLLAFLAYDADNIKQVFTISPKEGTPVQQTFHLTDVQSGVRWHPKEYQISYIWENSLVSTIIGSKTFRLLTKPTNQPPTNHVWSHDGSKIAFNRVITSTSGQSAKQIFMINL